MFFAQSLPLTAERSDDSTNAPRTESARRAGAALDLSIVLPQPSFHVNRCSYVGSTRSFGNQHVDEPGLAHGFALTVDLNIAEPITVAPKMIKTSAIMANLTKASSRALTPIIS